GQGGRRRRDNAACDRLRHLLVPVQGIAVADRFQPGVDQTLLHLDLGDALDLEAFPIFEFGRVVDHGFSGNQVGLGRPRPRRAMMLRWISFAPAPTVRITPARWISSNSPSSMEPS